MTDKPQADTSAPRSGRLSSGGKSKVKAMKSTNDKPQAEALKLLPCPFCGHEANAISDNGRGLAFNVHCRKCRATGPLERCAIDAKDTWNARATPEPSEAMVEQMWTALADYQSEDRTWLGIGKTQFARAIIKALTDEQILQRIRDIPPWAYERGWTMVPAIRAKPMTAPTDKLVAQFIQATKLSLLGGHTSVPASQSMAAVDRIEHQAAALVAAEDEIGRLRTALTACHAFFA